MTQTEALKIVLNAITQYLAESPEPSEEVAEGLCDAASAARKALAQPAQRKPLTTDQMYAAIRPLFKTDALAEAALSISFDEYQAIEAAHGIKEHNV